jgi:hypothetical protein
VVVERVEQVGGAVRIWAYPRAILIRSARPADVPGIITLFTAVAEERDSIGTEPGFDVTQRQSRILTSIEQDADGIVNLVARLVAGRIPGLLLARWEGLGLGGPRRHRTRGFVTRWRSSPTVSGCITGSP